MRMMHIITLCAFVGPGSGTCLRLLVMLAELVPWAPQPRRRGAGVEEAEVEADEEHEVEVEAVETIETEPKHPPEHMAAATDTDAVVLLVILPNVPRASAS